MSSRWDQHKFQETLREYAQWSRRTWRQIVDTKTYYVARKALWFTRKADAQKIKSSLGQIVAVSRMNRKGRLVRRREVQLVRSTRVDAPLAALIINARRAKANKPGLYGALMAVATRQMLALRARSVAFLKSGWLQAIRDMAPFADKGSAPAMDSDARQVGQAKGSATRSGGEDSPAAEIVNRATTRRDKNGALIRYAGPGLVLAVHDEEASMRGYIEDKMRPGTERANAKLR